jgi:MFS family permease
MQNRMAEALAVLELMGSPDARAELGEIRESIELERTSRTEPLFRRIRGKLKYGTPIFLAIAIGVLNQLSGINAILYYLNDIFAAAGFSRVSSNLQAVAVGAMNLVATLFAMTLIDRVGRKRLLLVGSVGTAACLGGVSVVFFTHRHAQMLVWLLVTYIAFFAISQGAVIWVYISEIFPTRVRGKGQSLGCSALWVMNALLSLGFPIVAQRSGAYPFVLFAVMMAVQFFVVLFLFPETKQASLEQLQERMGIA